MTFPIKTPYKITTLFSAGHPGLDLAPIPAGTRGILCYAPERATVISSGNIPSLEGNYIILQGASGMFYYFGHFENRLVGVGARVDEGQAIGVLGMTGRANGIHCHHEVRTARNGGRINPLTHYNNNQTQGTVNEMIGSREEAIVIYKLLRPNGMPSEDEINSTANKRTYKNFLNDATAELNARDANLVLQQQQYANMQSTIAQLQTADVSEHETINRLTGELASATSQLNELQTLAQNITIAKVETPAPEVVKVEGPKIPFYIKLIAKYFGNKKA